jgi:carbamoyltransferase
MNIISLSRNHDASLCLISDGDLVFHVQEERLSRNKKDPIPFYSLIELKKYIKTHDYLCISSTSKAAIIEEPRGCPRTLYDVIASKLFSIPKETFDFYGHHHLSHAANAFYGSGFSKAVCVVFDGSGSYLNLNINGQEIIAKETQSVFVAEYPNKFTCLYKLAFSSEVALNKTEVVSYGGVPVYVRNIPESYGIIFSALSTYLNFGDTEAGKTMGMAAYGQDDVHIKSIYSDKVLTPQFANRVEDKNIQYFWDTDEYFKDQDFKKLTNLAYRIQKDVQDHALGFILDAVKASGCKNICISGGYALNCTANYEYLKHLPPKTKLYVDPIPHDAGIAVGSAKYIWHEKTGDTTIRPLKSLYLGYEPELYVPKDVDSQKASYADVADLITSGNIVALYQGRAESGPRALGNRSILFDPRHPDGKAIVNTVKGREWFRPFAGTILTEKAAEWFDMRGLEESPFMTYAVNVKEGQQKRIPCIVHVDGSCRIQTVTETQNPHYYRLIQAFETKTEVPILFNTSFNLAGEPIVETIEDAIDTLRRSKLEYLYLPELETLVKVPNEL